jgi:hypothetical protein
MRGSRCPILRAGADVREAQAQSGVGIAKAVALRNFQVNRFGKLFHDLEGQRWPPAKADLSFIQTGRVSSRRGSRKPAYFNLIPSGPGPVQIRTPV